MKSIKFYKMEGAGNDFIVVDNREYGFSLDEIIAFTPTVCDRKYGIGADGMLILDKANIPEADYTMIYRNADGSDAGMCGNGGRCIALFATKNGFKNTHIFNVHEYLYKAEVGEDMVKIHFPVQVSPEEIMIEGKALIQANAATEHLVLLAGKEELTDEDELVNKGRAIRMSERMNPPGTNVNFVCIENDSSIHVQTYERGVENLTLACGTGALASAIAAHHHKKLTTVHADFDVQMKGGKLMASFDFDPDSSTYFNLILTGPAHFVFEGSISI